MRVLIILTYYRPHTSGLTIYAERLARGLARQGHEVTILTSHYSRDLPRRETRDGVHIVAGQPADPVFGRARAGVTEDAGPGRHPFAELGGKGGQ